MACAYEPDAILETDTGDCTRYFLEWDRGTEPVAGREKRTIQDKFERIFAYFWASHGLLDPGQHWSERGSHYLSAFPGAELRVPKVLLITTSAARAKNIARLADAMFDRGGKGARALVEILTVSEARSKLLNALEYVEQCIPLDEMPWVTERRFREVAAARARAVADRKMRIEQLRDPLLVPYQAYQHGEPTTKCVLSVTDARSLVAWFDRDRGSQEMRWTAFSSAAKPLDELREATHVGLSTRVASVLGFVPAAPDSVSIEFGDTRAVVRLASEVMRKRAQLGASADQSGESELLRVLGRLLVHARVDRELIPELVVACRAAWNDDDPASPWASVIARLKGRTSVAAGR